ncbi:MAG: Actin-like protein [Promethearchaeota archaeon]|nr:MAG: Actin-like protein [Candidatus Lokiarchaeota archaeon]
MSLENTNFNNALILDVGNSIFRLGWAGSDEPEVQEPSIYATTTNFKFQSDFIEGFKQIFSDKMEKECLFGREAFQYQGILNFEDLNVVENSQIFIEYFLHQYKKLNIPKEHQFKQHIIIIDPFLMTDLDKDKFKKIFFETLNFPSILFLPAEMAILTTLNKIDGVIVNIGEKNTYVYSVYRGFTDPMAKDRIPIGGRELTNYFLNMVITGKGANKNFFFDYWMAKKIKEEHALCVLHPKKERDKIKEDLAQYDRTIELPNKYSFTINFERFMLVEPLFNPRIIHVEHRNIVESIVKTIKFWEREQRAELLSNIILAGGSSKIPGMKERIRSELTKHFSEKLEPQIKIITPKNRDIMAWVGASILSSQGKLKKGIENPNL